MSSPEGLGLVAAALLLPFPIALIAAWVIVALRNSRLASTNARRQRFNQAQAERNAPALRPHLAPIIEQREQVVLGLRESVTGHFPPAYLHEEALVFVVNMFANHRANTITDAVNLYETELHRRRLENLAQAQLAEQQRATRVAQMNGVIAGVGHAATISAIRSYRR